MAKVVSQLAANLSDHAAGKGFTMFVPVREKPVFAGSSYWVADSLMTAVEQYHRHDCVELNDSAIKLAAVIDNLPPPATVDSSGHV